LDSLADVITFGVAPAILVYKWALPDRTPESPSARSTPPAAPSASRASNVLAHAESAPSGISSGCRFRSRPECWSRWSSLSTTWIPGSEIRGLWPIAALVLVLAFLMVSTIPLPHLQGSGLNPGPSGVPADHRGRRGRRHPGRPSLVLLVYFSIYILLG